jgi:hypothetical protein
MHSIDHLLPIRKKNIIRQAHFANAFMMKLFSDWKKWRDLHFMKKEFGGNK